MHRYKIVPPILLILSLVNFLLAAPVVLQEVRHQVGDVDMAADVPEDVIPVSMLEKKSDDELLEKRWDGFSGDEPEPEPWPQKRGSSSGSESSPAAPSVGEPAPQAADQELAPPNSPPSPQSQTGTTTSKTQDAASASSPEINKLPLSADEDHPSSGESYSSDHGGTLSENYLASDEGGPLAGPGKSYSDSSSNTDILGVGSNDGSLGSSKSYPPWNQPGELVSNMGGPWSTKSYPPSGGPSGPVPDSSNEGRPGSSMNQPLSNRPEMMSTGLVPDSPPAWNPHDWSTSSAEPEPEPKKKFMSKTRKFFNKLIYKIKFWPRGPRGGL